MVPQMDSQILMIRQHLLNAIKYSPNMGRVLQCIDGINLTMLPFWTVKMHRVYAVNHILSTEMCREIRFLLFLLDSNYLRKFKSAAT